MLLDSCLVGNEVGKERRCGEIAVGLRVLKQAGYKQICTAENTSIITKVIGK